MAAEENGHLKQILAGVFLLGVLGATVFLLYPGTHSNGGVVLEKNAEDIAAQGRRIIAAMDLDPAGFHGRATLTPDNPVLERMYGRYETPEANALLRSGVPGYTWKLRLLREDHEGSGPEKGESGYEEDMVRRMLTGDLLLVFDGHGRLLRLEIQTDDSLAAPALSDSDAYAALRRLLLPVIPPSRIGPLAAVQEYDDSLAAGAGLRLARSVLPRRVDHELRWSVYDEALSDTVDMRAVLSGELPTRFECVPRFSREFHAADTTGIADIFEAAVYVIFGIVLIVVLLRRLRNYEMGFRNAVFMGIGIALLFGAWMYYELGGQMRSAPELLIPLLIAPLFVGAGFVPLWAVGESLGRETWKEKLISFDLLRSGHLSHSRVGQAVLRGIVAGFAMLAIGLVMARLLGGIDAFWLRMGGGETLRPFSTPSPGLYAIGNALTMGLFATGFMLLCVVSLLRQRLHNKALVIVVPALMFTLMDGINLVPLPGAWLVIFPSMLLLIWLFVETDMLSAALALFVFSVLDDSLLLLLPSGGSYMADGMIVLAILALLLAWAVAAMLTPDRVTDFEAIAPRFQRHITERQRLSRELEIARDVQMSFLPKRHPVIPGLDIASHCAPALEVGGDYYDFIELGERRVGIAIGDVSGKGTQAAFYMTLTKGFLQALAWQHESPAEVLVAMNRLFYRNVERGHFISMIYAVFDMDARELRIARAGHSPVMRRSAEADVEIIQSRGIALGFEAGETFSATIEELRVPLRAGDSFVLYTDGYPEAMTKAREEYGEERLATALRQCGGTSAEELLSHLYRDTRRFTGRAEQHDDMTMVVVRVT